jgi:hypothetical protein
MKWSIEGDGGTIATVTAERWEQNEVSGRMGMAFYDHENELIAWFSGPRAFTRLDDEEAEAAPRTHSRRAPRAPAPELDNSPIASDGEAQLSPAEVCALMKEKIGDRPRKQVAGEISVNPSHLGQVLGGHTRASAKMIAWLGLQPLNRSPRARE